MSDFFARVSPGELPDRISMPAIASLRLGEKFACASVRDVYHDPGTRLRRRIDAAPGSQPVRRKGPRDPHGVGAIARSQSLTRGATEAPRRLRQSRSAQR